MVKGGGKSTKVSLQRACDRLENQIAWLGGIYAILSTDARTAYFALWQIINGANSVEMNPWCWRICYVPTFINVDAYLETL